MMSLHIVAYVLCILAIYSTYIDTQSVRAYEMTTISVLIANLFSSLMLAWVVYKLSQNTNKLVTFNTQCEHQTSFVSDEVFDNSALSLLCKDMKISFRSSMFNSVHSDAQVVVLDESSIDMNLRPTLD